jgi:hypothetical protein
MHVIAKNEDGNRLSLAIDRRNRFYGIILWRRLVAPLYVCNFKLSL